MTVFTCSHTNISYQLFVTINNTKILLTNNGKPFSIKDGGPITFQIHYIEMGYQLEIVGYESRQINTGTFIGGGHNEDDL